MSTPKKDAIALKQSSSITTVNLKAIESFQKILHEAPPPTEVRINKAAKNSAYLPISFIQMKLDEMFFGLWKTRNFTYQVIANELVGQLELDYFHPKAGVWLTRVGVGAAMIQMKSLENGGTGDITDVRNKITNTLVKDAPHLYAECVKNAAKTIGVSFGRDLNREHTDTYNSLTDELESRDVKVTEIELLLDIKQVPANIYTQLSTSMHSMTAERLKNAVNYLLNLPNKVVTEHEDDLVNNFTGNDPDGGGTQ